MTRHLLNGSDGIGKLRVIFIVFWLLPVHAATEVLSQVSVQFIEGKVINRNTSEPVPFAAVRLKEHNLGVYGNAEGDFRIINYPEFADDSLVITCIGYRRVAVAFGQLGNGVNTIRLMPAIYSLSEVKISASRRTPRSMTIIGRAIRNIRKNYPVNPFSYIAYYRDYQKKGKTYVNLNEAIIQTLDNGFDSKSINNMYRLLDFRENQEFARMSVSPFYELPGAPARDGFSKFIPLAELGDHNGNELFVLRVHDAIRNYDTRSFSFIETLANNFLYNHNFDKPVTVLNNNLPLYKIIFNSRSSVTGDSLMVSGAIYIQPEDYSIHKLEYTCYYQNRGRGLKKMFTIDTEYGYENGNKPPLSLKYISFNNLFMVPDTSAGSFFRVTNTYWTSKYWKTDSLRKATLVFDFNNEVDPGSAVKVRNWDIKIGSRNARISNIEANGKRVFIALTETDTSLLKDSCKVNMHNILDVYENIINRPKYLEFYQYRELFVQEYNKPLNFTDSCYIEYKPLLMNCRAKSPDSEKYWMNTPKGIEMIE